MSLQVYDDSGKAGYSLTDYNQKWMTPNGLGEMAVEDTRSFSGGRLHVSAVPFRAGSGVGVDDHRKYLAISTHLSRVPRRNARLRGLPAVPGDRHRRHLHDRYRRRRCRQPRPHRPHPDRRRRPRRRPGPRELPDRRQRPAVRLPGRRLGRRRVLVHRRDRRLPAAASRARQLGGTVPPGGLQVSVNTIAESSGSRR